MQQKVIRAQVDPAGIRKVASLFQGSVESIADELVQNSRRAGASKLWVDVEKCADGKVWVTWRDNGTGIDDPENLLTLLRSSWGGEVEENEEPAGAGFFSLASMPSVRVESKTWRIDLDPAAFSGQRGVHVEDICAGEEQEWNTSVTFCFPEHVTYAADVRYQIMQVAKRMPSGMGMYMHGVGSSPLVGVDPLLQSCYVKTLADGSRIGLLRGGYYAREQLTCYMRGKAVTAPVPLDLQDLCVAADVRVVVVVESVRTLGLVLPARNEVIKDARWVELLNQIERAVYAGVSEVPLRHTCTSQQRQRARELGFDLPQVSLSILFGLYRGCDDVVLYPPSYDPAILNGLSYLDMSLPALIPEREAYRGWEDYDRLSVLRQLTAEYSGEPRDLAKGDEGLSIQKVNDIRVVLHTQREGKSDTYVVETPCWVEAVTSRDYDLDEVGASIIVTEGILQEGRPLTFLLSCLFSASGDASDTEAEEQEQEFRAELIDRLRARLVSEDDALRVTLTERLSGIGWRLRKRPARVSVLFDSKGNATLERLEWLQEESDDQP
jgi:hypothetical protein